MARKIRCYTYAYGHGTRHANISLYTYVQVSVCATTNAHEHAYAYTLERHLIYTRMMIVEISYMTGYMIELTDYTRDMICPTAHTYLIEK